MSFQGRISLMSTTTAMRTTTALPTLMACARILRVQIRPDHRQVPSQKEKLSLRELNDSAYGGIVPRRSVLCERIRLNTTRDLTSGSAGYCEKTMETVADMNNLYEAFKASMKGSAWKEEPQRFEMDFLSELTALQNELLEKTYKTLPGSEFTLNERGHIRHIHGGRMRDRVVRHCLCDNVLGPSLAPYLIYNNGASQTGKGVSFARENFERDLHNYYLEHGNADGYVGFMDVSKFYDNIRHDYVKAGIYPKIDPFSAWLLGTIMEDFRVDVSYMTDDEYACCLENKFNSVWYYENITKSARTGEKIMEKSVEIGDQTSQDIGVFFPTPLDNYATIVRGCRRYGRYMDDIYLICETRDEVRSIIDGITDKAHELGMFINEKKTRICKLTDRYTYLQVRYFLTPSGKVVKRISTKSLTRERRRLKAYKRLLDKGEMEYDRIEQAYKSWMGTFYKIMSKRQISNIKQLYRELYGKEPRWK